MILFDGMAEAIRKPLLTGGTMVLMLDGRPNQEEPPGNPGRKETACAARILGA
jgi:hypothetical protein